jgi:signal peptidase II
MKFILIISLPLYALDQLTKYLVLQSLPPGGSQSVIPGFFDIVNVTNTGAAFGSFRNNNGFFIALSCLALLFVVTLLVRRRSRDHWRDVSLALLLAGILGNLSDRLLHGHVIDFILFNLHIPLADPWPAFNVADSCICVAVFCFIIHSFKHHEPAEEPPG